MPLPRRKDDGSTGAPVLKIPQAHVKLLDVEEHVEPYTVMRKSDGAEFTYDPDFKCTVEVIDDGRDGDDNGVTFFEKFKYKNTKKDKTGEWINQENSKLGALSKVVKPNYFEDASVPDLTAADLQGFEMICQLKPKKDPNTGKILGTQIDWETMEPLRETKKLATVPPAEEGGALDEDDFYDIPF
jgi:hypothetical protein